MLWSSNPHNSSIAIKQSIFSIFSHESFFSPPPMCEHEGKGKERGFSCGRLKTFFLKSPTLPRETVITTLFYAIEMSYSEIVSKIPNTNLVYRVD